MMERKEENLPVKYFHVFLILPHTQPIMSAVQVRLHAQGGTPLPCNSIDFCMEKEYTFVNVIKVLIKTR